jgi:chemotaxis protein MotA
MDIATILGLVLGCGLLFYAVMAGGSPLSAFYDLPSIVVVFGGTATVLFTCFPLSFLLQAPLIVKKVFLHTQEDVSTLIDQIVSLAETARRDGLLALEGRLQEIDNKFIVLGVQMAVDGTRPEVIEDIMRTEVELLNARHKEGKALLDQAGRYCPAYGMIGTLMGLIMMLGNMSDPSQIGAGMAVALITTLYGAIASNVVFLPFAEKLAYINKRELLAREIIIRGIMAIQSGENPRVIAQKLRTFLPPSLRAAAENAA